MTEDDTFKKLIKIPFDDMLDIVIRSNSYYKDVDFKRYGWTAEEYFDACKIYVCESFRGLYE